MFILVSTKLFARAAKIHTVVTLTGDLKTKCITLTNLHNKFHKPNSNSSSTIAVKSKAKYRFHPAAILS
jgi:hypothetical protein